MLSRPLAVLLLVAVAAAGAALAAGAGDERKTVPDSVCAPCHGADPVPFLRSAQMALPSGAGGKVGEAFGFAVTVQNAWRSEYELRYSEPTLDLSKAPSLQFSPDVPDYHNDTALAIAIDPGSLSTPQGVDHAYGIPTGATTVAFTVTPKDVNPATGPRLTVHFTPVSGDPVTVKAAGPGQKVTQTFTGADAARFSGGAVPVRVEVTPVDASTTPPTVLATTSVPFTVAVDAKFNLVGLTKLAIPIDKPLLGGASAIVNWPLVPVAAPQAGETVSLWVNTTGYYKHNSNGDGSVNWGNFTDPADKEKPTRLVLDVTQKGDRVVLTPQAGPTIVRPSVLNGATEVTISEAVGYASAFLLVSSIWSGGMFGKASRRSLNGVFGSAKRRVAFHNFLSYGIILAATVHMVLFLIEPFYDITLGLIWGGLAILAMLGLGVTGALQVPMIRRWSYNGWRWTHYGMTIAVLLFTVLHMLLDGAHFADVQNALHWTNPFPTRATA